MFELVNQVMQSREEEPPATDQASSISQQEKQRVMSENLNGGDLQTCRILEYKRKAPSAPEVCVPLYHHVHIY
jgi:indole-3-glycerol phosphate synthase